jgi:hypothetical protein
MGVGELDAPLVTVDAGDVRNIPPEAAGERSRPAADVEGTCASQGHGLEDHPVVVEIVAPRFR